MKRWDLGKIVKVQLLPEMQSFILDRGHQSNELSLECMDEWTVK